MNTKQDTLRKLEVQASRLVVALTESENPDQCALLSDSLMVVNLAIDELTSTPTLDGTATALTDKANKWKKITPDTPRGVKMLLINRHAGTSCHGTLGSNEVFFTHYFTLPTFEDDEQ